MFNELYMVHDEENNRWFVRVETGHYGIVAVSTKERALECVVNLVRKYKTPQAFDRSIKKTECSGLASKNSQIHFAEIFNHHLDEDLQTELHKVINDTLKDIRVVKQTSKLKRIKLQDVKVKETTPTEIETEEVPEIHLAQKDVRKFKVRKLHSIII